MSKVGELGSLRNVEPLFTRTPWTARHCTSSCIACSSECINNCVVPRRPNAMGQMACKKPTDVVNMKKSAHGHVFVHLDFEGTVGIDESRNFKIAAFMRFLATLLS